MTCRWREERTPTAGATSGLGRAAARGKGLNLYKGTMYMSNGQCSPSGKGVVSGGPRVEGGEEFSGRDYCSIVLPLLSTCANPPLPREFSTWPSQDLQSLPFSEGLD